MFSITHALQYYTGNLQNLATHLDFVAGIDPVATCKQSNVTHNKRFSIAVHR